ncbi:MAG TPA: helical backbone metal receptor, partial [Gemmatimonadales bacterium]|nr:helical backbone metal receptor [Gemmatimonadales bacterium]
MFSARFGLLRLAGLCLLTALAGCRPGPTPAASGTVTDDAGVAVTLPAPPRRVVSLIPAATELLFALGEGGRLVGRTTWCDWPAEAARVPDLGNGIDPSIEAVLGANPDLVLLYRSGSNRAAAERLRGLGVPVLELDFNSLADFRRITRLVGSVLGAARSADSLLAAFDRALEAAAPAPAAAPPTVFILVWDRPPITLGRGSFLSEIVALAGARNVFDDRAAPSGPVSIEAVARRDPDL